LSAAPEASGRRWIVLRERKCPNSLRTNEAHRCPRPVLFGCAFGSFNDGVVSIREYVCDEQRDVASASLLSN
jgi:hypothetical protein